jgi:transposase-like protein
MDTTYFGRSFGVMLFKDAITGKNLLKYYVKNETNKVYALGIDELIKKGFNIQAIVCDGRKGLLDLYPKIPTQMCQFHQVAIIRRYLTLNPKTEAGKELKAIVQWLKQTDKESFIGLLSEWETRWEVFLKERTINPLNQKTQYTHRRLRSAIRSLKNNLSYLFTWYDNMHIQIPNTTNAIDGHFANLKQKLRNHNGLSIKMKKQFIDEFLKA